MNEVEAIFATAAVAAVLSCVLVEFFAYLEGYQSEARHNRAYEYAEAAKANAIVRREGPSAAAVADCIYDEISSSQDQAQGEQDLDAQQWMAHFALNDKARGSDAFVRHPGGTRAV